LTKGTKKRGVDIVLEEPWTINHSLNPQEIVEVPFKFKIGDRCDEKQNKIKIKFVDADTDN
jgi:hypothetical protein